MGAPITQQDLNEMEEILNNKHAYSIVKIIFLFYFTIFILLVFSAYGTWIIVF